jgi:hypothetical protein
MAATAEVDLIIQKLARPKALANATQSNTTDAKKMILRIVFNPQLKS